MNFEEALSNFGKALGDLKRSYAEEYSVNPNYLSISINEENDITIVPTLDTGSYIECFRGWVDIDN